MLVRPVAQNYWRADTWGVSPPGLIMDIKREGDRPRELRTPRSERVHPRLLEKVGHLAPRIEHAGLHCRGGHPDDPRDFVHRLLVVVDEVEDFAVRRRELRQALLDYGAAVLVVHHGLGIIGGILD